MRHINTESALPQECSTGTGTRPEDEEDPEPWHRRQGLLMGYSPPELTCQKVYQVSIFSQPAGCSHLPEQRAPGRQPIKRACPEPQRVAEAEWDAKQGPWEEEDDAIEDGILVDDLSLGGAAQHFSHSGLRVVEHRQEGSPSPCGSWEPGLKRTRRGTPQAPPTPCSTLHTRGWPPASPGDHPVDCASTRRQEENGGPQDRADGSQNVLLDPDLHKLAHQSPPGEAVVSSDRGGPGTPTELLSSEANGLGSAEKTPCASIRHSGREASSCCPAKRKLLPSVEGLTDPGSEDEGLSPARKKRALQRPAVPASCRSTDAKGAPFWNHLLPAAAKVN